VTKRRDTDDELPRLYSPDEVAQAIRCSEWWVKEQARKGRIPFTRTGGAYRFTAEHYKEIIRVFEERPAEGTKPGVPTGTSPVRRARRAAPTTAPVVQLRARAPRRGRKVA
jgi:excisionase family DNA binding protein